MAITEGNSVIDPRRPHEQRMGKVIAVRRNPACLMRTLVIRWSDEIPTIEEMEEIEFGPLED
ncbi:MAG: hypothetical protein M1272_04595 [Firmicutes bacterium]|nr:hypothetical protein [Bacillota bacterium]